MSVIPLRLKKETKIREYINQFLINIGQDCGEEWWNSPTAIRALERLTGTVRPQVTDSFELCIDCRDIFVIGSWNGGTDAETLEQLMGDVRHRIENIPVTAPDEKQKKKTFQFLFFTSDLKSRTALEMKLDQAKRRELAGVIKKASGVPAICKYTFVVDREYRGEIACIRNINRFDSVPMPSISGNPNTDRNTNAERYPAKHLPSSIVLTASLRQLVELYNQVGDQLFKRNVRLGISDEMDVQRAMCQTLEKEPEYFWYMNNGVTLLVDDPAFRLHSADSLEFGTLEFDSVPRFSVINGAQTISICSKYAFEWEYYRENCPEKRDEAERRLKNFEKAQVILRVIHVPLQTEQRAAAEERENVRLANNISISLNRQKPARQEDIAFTTPFVQKMLGYLEDEADAPFYLVRRGENRGYVTQLDLVAFSKAQLACMNRPGSARAVSSGEIMELDFDTGNFRRTDIFVEQWLADDINCAEVFRRFYGAVLFASQLEACYKRNLKTVQREMQEENRKENALSVLSNGSWYFTALLVQLLNSFSTDYSKFDCSAASVSDRIPRAMRMFADMAVYCAGEKRTLNSNDFKNETLYTKMLGELEKARRKPLFQEFAELFAPSVEKVPQKNAPPGLHQIDYGPAFHCESPAPVGPAAGAFTQIVKDILARFAPDPAGLEDFSAWLTDDRQKCLASHNYVKTPPEVVYNGKTYWIGTSISNESKFSYLDRLCGLAGVPRGEITWKRGDLTLYKW